MSTPLRRRSAPPAGGHARPLARAVLMALALCTGICLGPTPGAVAQTPPPVAWPPIPVDWSGEGTLPTLLSLEGTFHPPDRVVYTLVLTANEDGRLTLALPDRSGLGGSLEVDITANGLPVDLERRTGDPGLRIRDLGADLLHESAMDLTAGQMLVLRSEVRLRDTWTPYLEPGETPAWHTGDGPMLVPYWKAGLDLRAAATWALHAAAAEEGSTGAEIAAGVRMSPAPLPHLPLLGPRGWQRHSSGPRWEGTGDDALRRLDVAVPALETESLVLDDPVALRRWLDTEPGLPPEARDMLAAAVEARAGNPFDDDPRARAWFEGRSWYRPEAAWDPMMLARRDRRAIDLILGQDRPEAGLRTDASTGAPDPAPSEPVAPPAAAEPAPRPATPASPAATAENGAGRPSLEALGLPADEEAARRWVEEARRRGISRRQVKVAKNTYFARRGYVFRSPWLQEHFEAQPWYEPEPEAGIPPLPADERRAVAVLAALERELPADDSPEPEPDRPALRTASASPSDASAQAADGPLPSGYLSDPTEIPSSAEEARRWVEEARRRGLDTRAVRAARNAVFARHGRSFRTPWLQDFFRSLSWYREDPGYRPDRLDREERAAVQVLLEYEQSLRSEGSGTGR